MKKSFLEWLREVLPNDHAVKQQYHLSWLIAEYPDLYEDFEAGNDTIFAKLYFDKGLGDMDCYKEIREIYDIQQQEIESLKAQLADVKSTNHSLEEINADLSESLKLLKDKYQSDGWISVEDRLPDDSDVVLVYDTYHGFTTTDKTGCYKRCRFKDNAFWLEEVDNNWCIEAKFWQPLPNPPKGASK